MKKCIIGMFLLMGLSGWGQVDSLEFTTRRQVADTVFGLLDKTLYGSALIERSMTDDPILMKQLKGDYSEVSHGWNWLQAYSDIAMSYVDSTYMFSDSVLYNRLENFQLEMTRDTSDLDELKQPLGILLHHVSRIDSTILNFSNAFSNDRSQLKLSENIDESTIYQKLLLKNAALLELYGEHGYHEGKIVYNEDFISTSSDISIQSIQLNVGNGFQRFSAVDNEITYTIRKSFQQGQVLVNYTLNGVSKSDTLPFYLTTDIYKNGDHDYYDKGPWESPVRKFRGDLKYCILYGCGNADEKIRRPVLIAPPYRPGMQDVSFSKYYDQFNFKSLLNSLEDMGYDVIFIKETPGNRGIDHAGSILGDFIKFINVNKKDHFPNEDWENVVIGFSAGGQHWRYALKKLEKEHMETGTPHHHTRLYIPYDSPHWGANVPMFAQAVFKDLESVSIMAFFTYTSLKDAASKDMLMNHILGSTITENNHVRTISPAPTAERLNIVNQLTNNFNHQFTPMNDLRRSFPAFTRNVAVSLGGNEADYNSSYSLFPGMKLFSQNVFAPAWYGSKTYNRSIYSSQYGTASQVFKREDLNIFLGIPVWFKRHYKTDYAYEWDMAQGGYKDEFYDEGHWSVNNLQWSGIPVGAVNILLTTASNALLPIPGLWGTQHYNGHISFLPLVSALGINPSIWQNNNLYYNLKDHDLMYNQFNSNVQSDVFGYPNLAHPTNHFNITPFEAIYCDPQTYEHIKMQASIDENNGMDENYLYSTRDFILDEVEAETVYLQNKIIGKNHVQWDPNYRYKAWYKAKNKIVIGDSVTPKTDFGPFVIESTGEVTVYACKEIHMPVGFSTNQGGVFHAYIHCDGCDRIQGRSESTNDTDEENDETSKALADDSFLQIATDRGTVLQVYPNPSSGELTIVFPQELGSFSLFDMNGVICMDKTSTLETRKLTMHLAKGIYLVRWQGVKEVITKKIIVL